ncbi:MAG: PepSY domain-containing protein [Methanothermobacter sp.]|nr:PepSY domain-containing protein [Methanothermobacter sp.]
MIDSKIIISVTIVLIIGAIAASYQISNNPEILWQPTNPDGTIPPSPGTGDGAGGASGAGGGSTGGGSTGTGGGASGSAGGSGSSSNGISIGSNGGYPVSPSEAQNIAQGYIKEKGATAGTPRLVTIGGEPVYVVPIEKNGKIIGEIHIDPITGKNIGGGGGAPP